MNQAGTGAEGPRSSSQLVPWELAVRAIQDRDERAWDVVYARLWPPLLRRATLLLGNVESAKEAVHEALARSLPRRRRGDGPSAPLRGGWDPTGPASFSTWAFQVLRNYCIDELRKRHPAFEPIDDDAHGPILIDFGAEIDERERVRCAILRLPERFRVPLVLQVYEGLSIEDIAKQLDRPAGTVKSQIFEAKKRLLPLLQNPPETVREQPRLRRLASNNVKKEDTDSVG